MWPPANRPYFHSKPITYYSVVLRASLASFFHLPDHSAFYLWKTSQICLFPPHTPKFFSLSSTVLHGSRRSFSFLSFPLNCPRRKQVCDLACCPHTVSLVSWGCLVPLLRNPCCSLYQLTASITSLPTAELFKDLSGSSLTTNSLPWTFNTIYKPVEIKLTGKNLVSFNSSRW